MEVMSKMSVTDRGCSFGYQQLERRERMMKASFRGVCARACPAFGVVFGGFRDRRRLLIGLRCDVIPSELPLSLRLKSRKKWYE